MKWQIAPYRPLPHCKQTAWFPMEIIERKDRSRKGGGVSRRFKQTGTAAGTASASAASFGAECTVALTTRMSAALHYLICIAIAQTIPAFLFHHHQARKGGIDKCHYRLPSFVRAQPQLYAD